MGTFSKPHAGVALLCVFLFAGWAVAQTEIYKPYKNATMWSAETLYVGAGFSYHGGGPITVSVKGSESLTDGKLYFINPATSDTLYLFDNRAAPGTAVEVSKSTLVPKGGDVVFMYVPENNHVPKFTGANRSADRYKSAESSDDNVKPNYRYGHRWSVAGRTKGGGVEFGFEDWAFSGSDMDFDDAIFEVKGLELDVLPRSLKSRDLVR